MKFKPTCFLFYDKSTSSSSPLLSTIPLLMETNIVVFQASNLLTRSNSKQAVAMASPSLLSTASTSWSHNLPSLESKNEKSTAPKASIFIRPATLSPIARRQKIAQTKYPLALYFNRALSKHPLPNFSYSSAASRKSGGSRAALQSSAILAEH